MSGELASLLVEGFRWACAAECAADEILAKLGWRRRYFSQKGQDRWVVERALPGRIGGFFVEIGVGDGRTHSNTYALERDFGWSGLLVEANPKYMQGIERLRRSRAICCAAGSKVGKAPFLALDYMGGLIGDDTDYAPSRRSATLRRHADKVISVPQRPLADILDAAAAPAQIDYLSIDVEGAEARILRPFPFHRYSFDAITVERPTPELHSLLTNAGYLLDKVKLYDGFYVSSRTAKRLALIPKPFSGMRPKWF